MGVLRDMRGNRIAWRVNAAVVVAFLVIAALLPSALTAASAHGDGRVIVLCTGAQMITTRVSASGDTHDVVVSSGECPLHASFAALPQKAAEPTAAVLEPIDVASGADHAPPASQKTKSDYRSRAPPESV